MSDISTSSSTPVQYTLIITGEEILSGKRIDRHIPFLNKTLYDLGLECLGCRVIGDSDSTLSELVKDALIKSDVVIVTGGLGPTLDDITREALSDATGIGMEENPQALKELQERFASMGRPMTDNNKRQALVPVQGRFFSNPNGTAPGLVFDLGNKLAVALPGPPRELEPMVLDAMAPFLMERFHLKKVFRSATLRFCCLGESNIDAVVREKLDAVPDLRVSSLSHLGTVELTLSLPDHGLEAEEALHRCVEVLRAEIGDYLYAEGQYTLEEIVGSLLKKKKETLAVAESCTGGLLGAAITSIPGSSDYFNGGVIAYTNTIKTECLDVDPDVITTHGAVSEECAAQMAAGACKSLNSDWGVAVTGIAGPGGGTGAKPVGTVCIAVASRKGAVEAKTWRFFGAREAIRRRSVVSALDQLRRILLNLPSINP
ncbi:MAG: competence/damage-inducible protein A [Candidatus Omnitrophica bacterium]|nr:competence/damage-inducible protein A [Candidatus Omnitrophota bacterium]